MLAEDAARAIAELRLHVPEQLRIVVHANKGSGVRFPFPVTRIEVDPAQAAALLGSMLMDLLDGTPVVQRHNALPFEVITPVCDRELATEIHQPSNK